MILYHGSNQEFDVIDLSKSQRYKDFGQGFYLTSSLQTAERMARKKSHLFGGNPIVISYEFDEKILTCSPFKTKTFPKQATAEWLRFIDKNRDRKQASAIQEYDIICGPIADDGVVLQLTNYRNGLQTAEQTAEMLQDRYFDQQYCFGTVRSLELLTVIEVCRLQ